MPFKDNKIDIKVNVVIMQSFLWSSILACNKILLYFLYIFLVYIYKESFVIIVVIHTITNHHENIISFPSNNVLIASIIILTDTIIIEIAINSENMYSAFPCPKLWSSSPGTLAILFPIEVISDANMSPALFILSAIIAWLLLVNPIIAFIANKNTFPIIPYIPAFFVTLNLSSINSPS